MALLLAAFLVVLAFCAGMQVSERSDRDFWATYGYCPTCDRLTTEQEIDA